MQNKSKIKIIILAVAILFFLTAGGGATYLLNRLFHLEDYKTDILATVEQGLKRPVSYDKGSFSLKYGPSFTFTNVTVGDPGKPSPLLTAKQLTAKVALIPLLSGNLAIKEFLVDRPRISLIRHSDGTFNTDDLFSGEGGSRLEIDGIRLKNAYVIFTDNAVPGGLVTALEDLDLSVAGLTRGEKWEIKGSSLVITQGGKGIVSFAGVMRLPHNGEPWTATYLKGRMLAKNLDVAHFRHYYQQHIPFQSVETRLGLTAQIKGTLSNFTSKGVITATGTRLSWPSVFHSTLAPQELRVSYDLELTPQNISIENVDATLDDIRVKGSCSIKDIPSGDPRIIATATTSPLPLRYCKPFIPFGIIPHDTSKFIEEKIVDGTFTIRQGTLNGRVSQIVHMGAGANYRVLSVQGTAMKAAVDWGRNVPKFTEVSGNLELTGKDFILKNMTGLFGSSPFTLDGSIANFSTSKSAAYPFTATASPRQADVAWLLGHVRGSRLTLAGDSALKLAGEGTHDEYHLRGEWDLTPASYTYEQAIAKPMGLANLVTFSLGLTAKEAALSSLRFECKPLSMEAAGSYSFAEKQINLAIETNPIQLQDAASFIPLLKSYQCRGKVSASVHGHGRSDGLRWKGKIALNNVSLKPPSMKSISNLTGDITFRGNTLESPLLATRIGDTIVYCKGSITGFSDPVFNLAFSSPELDLRDFGFGNVPAQLKIEKTEGNIAYNDGVLRIKSLTSHINDSTITMSGTIDRTANSAIDLAISSPYLIAEDLLALSKLKRGAGGRDFKQIKADLTIDTGKLGKLDFKKLQADVRYQPDLLSIDSISLAALGGKISGSGSADFSKEKTSYRGKIDARELTIATLAPLINADDKLVAGKLSALGELTAAGTSFEELKSTLAGNIAVTIEQGRLHRFPVLSKVFSILNVSQLLKFKLPDMVSGGMPFDRITGHFTFLDGLVTTEDLFVHSNAMNISIVGAANLLKEEVDLAIGVQPLQTVDKVVNRIPIVGWVLTGNDGSLISAYFEAKGKWDDPIVKAVPVKSMAKGVLDIFKRVFQLPAKLITDTEKVIVGQ